MIAARFATRRAKQSLGRRNRTPSDAPLDFAMLQQVEVRRLVGHVL
jgi:hypothetical protein